VSYLVELKKPLLDEMMNDFYVAMNSYVSVIRDQSKTERELPQVSQGLDAYLYFYPIRQRGNCLIMCYYLWYYFMLDNVLIHFILMQIRKLTFKMLAQNDF